MTRRGALTIHHTCPCRIYIRSAAPSELTEEFEDICNELCKLLRFVELNAEVNAGLWYAIWLWRHSNQLAALKNRLPSRPTPNPTTCVE